MPITESMLASIWSSRVLCRRELRTTSGDRLRVLYPGMRNVVGGPDFENAIVDIKGDELRGDVELHVKASGWRAHGHHRDPGYNRVVLHVVYWDDVPAGTTLQNGSTVPVLSLGHLLYGLDALAAAMDVPQEPCSGVVTRIGGCAVGAILDEAGDQRFRIKAQRFLKGLEGNDGDQVLYEGLMRSLGYSRNSQAFEELARRVPLSRLRDIAHVTPLDRRRHALEIALVEMADGLCWHVGAVRPLNLPRVRIAAAAALLAGHIGGMGLGGWLLGLVQQSGGSGGCRRLERELAIRRGRDGAVLGQGRVRDMVVNIVLPFPWLWRRSVRRWGGMRRSCMRHIRD